MRAAAARDTVITGLGAVCALADDCDGLWSAIVERRSGIAPIRRFPTEEFTIRLGALVERWAEPHPAGRELTSTLCRRFAEQALREAMRSASLTAGAHDATRVALVFGTGIADLERTVHTIAEQVADELGVLGPRLTVSTACSSSTAAIGFGRDLLAMDAADVVIAGGADVLTPEVFAGFHALGVLSTGKCAPFSAPAGTTLGEGAGFLVLERHAHATARGATIVAGLAGYGLAGDGWHETSPDPKGAGVERAIRAALRDAALDAGEIGYVNVHGSGTEANDLSEWLGLQRALGERARAIPVSSTKGALGHAQGAAGVLETIATLLAMAHDTVPPTLNFTTARAQSPADPVAQSPTQPTRWAHALKLNSAFGGSNASLVLSRASASRVAVPREPVYVLGVGAVGPRGLGDDAFARDGTTDEASPRRPRRVPPFAIDDVVPSADPRGLDPASRFLTAAAALALGDAGLAIRGALRDRAGLLVGQLRGSAASIGAFQRSIDERGLPHLSPSAFARIVLNAAAGACSKVLSLRGPLSAVTTGDGSGLAAIVLAAELLATRDDADAMVAGGCDELATGELDDPDIGDEGAACVVLANARGVAQGGVAQRGVAQRPGYDATAPIALAGWALAAPGALDEVSDRLLVAAGADRAIDTFRAEDTSGGGGTGGAIAFADAVRFLRRGGERALVTSGAGRSAGAAVLLTRSTHVA